MENVILAEMPLTHAGAVDFDALVYAHARFVLNVAYSVLRNAEDAEDVVQETFLRAFRSGDIEKVERMRAWLARIAWRLAVNRLRQRSGSRRNDEYENLIRTLPAKGIGAEELLLMKERETLLARLLPSLPGDLRETFALLSVEGMTAFVLHARNPLPGCKGLLHRSRRIPGLRASVAVQPLIFAISHIENKGLTRPILPKITTVGCPLQPGDQTSPCG